MSSIQSAFRLSACAVLLAAIVVTLGAYTRLADAGLGCPDWPGCYGFLTVPQSEVHIVIAEARFPETPVEAHKGWAEMVHRYVAGILGVLIAALAVMAIRQRRTPGYPLGLSLGLLLLVVVQAAFGMWTVTLKLWPQVVTLHLLGGFATLGLLLVLSLRLRHLISHDAPETLQQRTGAPRVLMWLALLLVIVQIALGGWTSANYAAYACPDFPTCHGEWWPEQMALEKGLNITQHVGPNYLGGQLEGPARVGIHMMHRLGAVTVTLVISLLCVALWRRQLRGEATAVLAALALQLAIGIANVFWQFPLLLALAHNSGAALLLLVLCALLTQHYLARSLSHSRSRNKELTYENHQTCPAG